MPIVVGIRFKDSGKTYFFDPHETNGLQPGEHVIVETVRGPEIAKVAYLPREATEQELVSELKPVLRRAVVQDFERLEQLNERQDDVLARCAEKIVEHQLPMRLVKSEYSFDGSRLTFYFTAEKRVDFRMLVRDLARTFRTRIELRQIGPRDEAKLLGGIGPCGRVLCCATFLPDYARVSIKMAKDQDLPLNPSKISGVCGRLLCCLSYEHDQYLEIKNELPRRGAWVQTPDGPGEVTGINVVRETVTVLLAENGVHEEFSASQVQEAIRKVGDIARGRNEEGITPAAQRPRREPKHHGERRLLREEIDNPEILEALALLEDGMDDDQRHQNQRRPDQNRQQNNDRQHHHPHQAPRQDQGQRNDPPLRQQTAPNNEAFDEPDEQDGSPSANQQQRQRRRRRNR